MQDLADQFYYFDGDGCLGSNSRATAEQMIALNSNFQGVLNYNSISDNDNGLSEDTYLRNNAGRFGLTVEDMYFHYAQPTTVGMAEGDILYTTGDRVGVYQYNRLREVPRFDGSARMDLQEEYMNVQIAGSESYIVGWWL